MIFIALINEDKLGTRNTEFTPIITTVNLYNIIKTPI